MRTAWLRDAGADATTAKAFLSAEWRLLTMINFTIDPQRLAPWVPWGTELDTHAGRTFVSMVGFRFLGTSLLGWSVPGHRDFDEVNLRFYVRREQAGELRRGVVFVKEIVPRAVVAWLAREVYGENYVALPMRHEVMADERSARTLYEWKSGDRWHRIAASGSGTPTLPDTGSEAEFITEHYWGYARQRDGSTVEYRVEHPRWRVWEAPGATLTCDATGLYGSEFADALASAPTSAFIAEGSEVVVRRGARL